MKSLLKKLFPESLLLQYHRFNAYRAAKRYGFPTQKMTVIAITGTKGKTSTANYVWSVLTAAGFKTGLIGTANIRIGEKETMNPYHMTMPGPFILQKIFADMVAAGCTHVVLEITSEGIKQFRHKGIKIDIAVFTNLFPEHLQSHGGSFEKYKETKGIIFKDVPTIIANTDSEHAAYYLNNPAKTKITFGLEKSADIKAAITETTSETIKFKVSNDEFTLKIPGIFNVYNALGAMAVATALKIPTPAIKSGLASLSIIPGRMEAINEGQPFKVFVDYAHEKESIGLLLATAKKMVEKTNGKIILLLGAEGGGRDKAKRPAMGELAGKLADYVIVSNVDPYDDDPQEIIEDIAKVVEAQGKTRNQNLFTIEDRRSGIAKALSLASLDDIVLISCKGSEQSMIIKDQKIPWDDRKVVREELKKLY